jgi:hypothetical protein
MLEYKLFYNIFLWEIIKNLIIIRMKKQLSNICIIQTLNQIKYMANIKIIQQSTKI